MGEKSDLRAVITADVIGFTDRLSASDRERFADSLHAAFARLAGVLPTALPHPLSVFGGDSWQCYVHDSEEALRVALYLRGWVRSTFNVDVRLALAVDSVDFVNHRNVAQSDGAAFRHSGRLLEELDDRSRLAIALRPSLVNDGNDDASGLLLHAAGEAIARLSDRIARHWTPAQAQSIAWRLLDPEITQEEIGERWTPDPISQQSVAKHLHRGGWTDLEASLALFRGAVGSAHRIQPSRLTR